MPFSGQKDKAMEAKKISILAKLALFGATLIWGSSFFIMKNTVEVIPVFYLLAMRFFVAAIVVLILSINKIRLINIEYLIKGGVMGILLFLAYAFQTFGLMDISPGTNAFLTTVYCIIVPFLYWIVAKSRPDRFNILASIICLIGIGLVSLNKGFTIGIGDFLTLVCGFFYASHIVSVAVFSRKLNIFLLTFIQFATASVLGGIMGLIFETFPKHIGTDSILSLVYLCFFATAAALLMQNVGQKYTHPSTAALILSLESVFGVLFSIVFYKETLDIKITIGFVLIFVAVIISETKLSFLSKSDTTVIIELDPEIAKTSKT